uniref:sensor histidine kinase n=2 Tax=unclassified Streptomyces TaxID=2593676 RepID=UPI001CA4A22E
RWEAAHGPLAEELAEVRETARAQAREDAGDGSWFGGAGALVLLGLLALGAAVLVALRTGRELLADLAALRAEALDIARRKLPRAMRRIRSGGSVDIATEAPEHPGAHDEIARVQQALGAMHRAALRNAGDGTPVSADTPVSGGDGISGGAPVSGDTPVSGGDGISPALVSLARRGQHLVNRQLVLLDELERRTEDPSALEELFRLDHLSTRMRRQCESLLVLSGSEPARSWSAPVPLATVLQAAVSEIEDYRRIELRTAPGVGVAGGAVADLTHLLAELLENAARFSPPHTWVRVTGHARPDGFECVVEDRGPGLDIAALRHANLRIARCEAPGPEEPDRLGLFVVGRLAARHGVRVELRTAAHSGTAASVLLPASLLSPEEPLPYGAAQDAALSA